MAGRLIVPERHRSGFSEAEVLNIMAGLERLDEAQLAAITTAVIGEVVNRHGPAKGVATLQLVMRNIERAGQMVS
jgi:hypothetical protein